MEAPKEWNGTPEQWDKVIEAFGNLVVAIREAFKPIVKTFQELYSSLYDVTANPELKRLIKKAKRQQSIRDKRQQFYNSKAWELFRAARAAEQLGIDIYEYYTTGRIVEAENYHHIQEITEAWARRLDAANVIGLSETNHRRIHKEYDRSYKAKRKMQMILYAMLERFYREFVLDGGL